ncbi:MAG TPA: zinc-binding protein [Firmicutes bacterium]|nr:zinc-binding protein [Bacillota bacterium]
MAAFVDKVLVCRDCGREFVFSAGEQAFYQEKGFQHDPVRCPECRRSRKEQRSGGAQARQREMFAAVCADCGAETEVPFRPQLDRPVYCRSCFAKHRNR